MLATCRVGGRQQAILRELSVAFGTFFCLPLCPVVGEWVVGAGDRGHVLPLTLDKKVLVYLVYVCSNHDILLQDVIGQRASHVRRARKLYVRCSGLRVGNLGRVSLRNLSIVPRRQSALFALTSAHVGLGF